MAMGRRSVMSLRASICRLAIICFWLLCAANNIIRFVGRALDLEVFLSSVFGFIEQRIGDIAAREYRQGKDERFRVHSCFSAKRSLLRPTPATANVSRVSLPNLSRFARYMMPV